MLMLLGCWAQWWPVARNGCRKFSSNALWGSSSRDPWSSRGMSMLARNGMVLIFLSSMSRALEGILLVEHESCEWCARIICYVQTLQMIWNACFCSFQHLKMYGWNHLYSHNQTYGKRRFARKQSHKNLLRYGWLCTLFFNLDEKNCFMVTDRRCSDS